METVNTIIKGSTIMPMGTYGSVCPSSLISEPVNLQMNSYEVLPSWEGNVPQSLQQGLKNKWIFKIYTRQCIIT